MTYPPQAPWTGVGSLQGEISSIRTDLTRKVSHEDLQNLKNRVLKIEQDLTALQEQLEGHINGFQHQTEKCADI